MVKNQHNASVLITGNEILSGRTQDLNINFIAKRLSELGIEFVEARVIQDKEDTIIRGVNELRKKYDYVFTTGGIGPTHDDITAQSVAKAFGKNLIRSPEAVELIKAHYKERGKTVSEASLKMADVPEGAILIKNGVSGAPGFCMENVFVMAGVPSIVESMFANLEHMLNKGDKFISKAVTIGAGESVISEMFEDLQKKYSELDLGSYPYKVDGLWQVTLVIRGQDEDRIMQALKDLTESLKSRNIDYSINSK